MQNLQMIEVRYLGASNTRGARVKLIDTRFNASRTLARDYVYDNVVDHAIDYLQKAGFNIVAKCQDEIKGIDYLLLSDFKPIA